MRGHDAFVAKGTPRNLIGCGSRKTAIAFVSPKGGNARLSPQASVRDFRGLVRAACCSFSTGNHYRFAHGGMSPLLGSLALPTRACPHTGPLPSLTFRCASTELMKARKGRWNGVRRSSTKTRHAAGTRHFEVLGVVSPTAHAQACSCGSGP